MASAPSPENARVAGVTGLVVLFALVVVGWAWPSGQLSLFLAGTVLLGLILVLGRAEVVPNSFGRRFRLRREMILLGTCSFTAGGTVALLRTRNELWGILLLVAAAGFPAVFLIAGYRRRQ